MTRQIAVFAFVVAAAATGVVRTAWDIAHPATGGHVDLKWPGSVSIPNDATDADLPRAVRDVDGRVVWLEGFVSCPGGASDRLRTFQVVYNVTTSSPPPVQARVFATVTGGRTISDPGMYTMVTVRGVLHVGVRRDEDGRIASVYRLDADDVEPAS